MGLSLHDLERVLSLIVRGKLGDATEHLIDADVGDVFTIGPAVAAMSNVIRGVPLSADRWICDRCKANWPFTVGHCSCTEVDIP